MEHTLAPRCFTGRPGPTDVGGTPELASSPQRCWMRPASLPPFVALRVDSMPSLPVSAAREGFQRTLTREKAQSSFSMLFDTTWMTYYYYYYYYYYYSYKDSYTRRRRQLGFRPDTVALLMLLPSLVLLCAPMAASREHHRHQEATAMAGAFSRFGGQGLAGSVGVQELPNFLRYVVSSMASPAAPQDQVVARSSELTKELMQHLPSGVCGRHLLPKGARVSLGLLSCPAAEAAVFVGRHLAEHRKDHPAAGGGDRHP